MGWISIAWKFGVAFVQTLLGMKKSDQEKLGIQETQNENATAGLGEAQRVADATQSNDIALRTDPNRLRDGTDSAAARYSGGPD